MKGGGCQSSRAELTGTENGKSNPASSRNKGQVNPSIGRGGKNPELVPQGHSPGRWAHTPQSSQSHPKFQ